jgi:hypothetical protein
VIQQELDLLEIAAVLAAAFGVGAAKVVRADADLFDDCSTRGHYTNVVFPLPVEQFR